MESIQQECSVPRYWCIECIESPHLYNYIHKTFWHDAVQSMSLNGGWSIVALFEQDVSCGNQPRLLQELLEDPSCTNMPVRQQVLLEKSERFFTAEAAAQFKDLQLLHFWQGTQTALSRGPTKRSKLPLLWSLGVPTSPSVHKRMRPEVAHGQKYNINQQ